jgi:hypothetical protein
VFEGFRLTRNILGGGVFTRFPIERGFSGGSIRFGDASGGRMLPAPDVCHIADPHQEIRPDDYQASIIPISLNAPDRLRVSGPEASQRRL